MILTGTLINVITVIVGSLIGLLLGNIIPQRLQDTIMKGLALGSLYIGISGLVGSSNALIPIISMVVGALIGELLSLDDHLNSLAGRLEKRLDRGNANSTLAQAFITTTLLFCVGAMTITGSLQSGLVGDHSTLITKSIMDMVSSIIFASSLGIGVMLSAVSVFVIEGSISCLAGLLAPLLQYGNTITEMTVTGSILIMGLAFNMLGITKLKLMNYIPAIFIPILLCRFF